MKIRFSGHSNRLVLLMAVLELPSTKEYIVTTPIVLIGVYVARDLQTLRKDIPSRCCDKIR
jgi:hypothetical protein